MIIKSPKLIEKESCYIFRGKDIILRKDLSPISPTDMHELCQCIGKGEIWSEPDNNIAWLTIKDGELPECYVTQPVRFFAHAINDEARHLQLMRAKALSEWVINTQYCSQCGTTLIPHPILTAMQCPNCNKLIFPRIEPCIIVLVRKGDMMLLARHNQRNNDIYALIAGFMEAGETAEQAVRRELMEETGITVKNIKYFGTQSWPFPSQLMIAFTAEWESGIPRPQDGELADIKWFKPGECKNTPQQGSIAHRMISQFGNITKTN